MKEKTQVMSRDQNIEYKHAENTQNNLETE